MCGDPTLGRGRAFIAPDDEVTDYAALLPDCKVFIQQLPVCTQPETQNLIQFLRWKIMLKRREAQFFSTLSEGSSI